MQETKLPMPIQLEGRRVMGTGQGTTAAGLGLVGGDLLVSVAGVMVTEGDVDSALANVKPGDTVRAHWIRKGSLVYADAPAMTLTPMAVLTSITQLGAALGPPGRESAETLAAPATSSLSGFQRGILDVSTQGAEHAKMQRMGGIAFGVVTALGAGWLASKLFRPRLPAPANLAVLK